MRVFDKVRYNYDEVVKQVNIEEKEIEFLNELLMNMNDRFEELQKIAENQSLSQNQLQESLEISLEHIQGTKERPESISKSSLELAKLAN